MASTCGNMNLLKQAQLFADLSLKELESISCRVTLREFKKGEVILYEEDANKYMYSVLEGEVKVYYSSEDGKESIVAFHGAGESFGEVSLIDQKTIPAMVAAMEKSLVLVIGRDDFFAIIQSQPKVMHKLLLLLSGRLRHSWKQVRMLHFKDASNRVMASIKEMAAERGEVGPEGVLLTLRLTHQNIADLTGLTRETVTRIIDKWKKSGLVSLDENRHMLIRHSFFEENFSL
ncbi:MAG: Crp/Fnr family transcriptional regulator [Desulfuromonadales bacterium]|nr:Crp/Fnr family transcriptional regulator [Desulfuromonadales bacterium]